MVVMLARIHSERWLQVNQAPLLAWNRVFLYSVGEAGFPYKLGVLIMLAFLNGVLCPLNDPIVAILLDVCRFALESVEEVRDLLLPMLVEVSMMLFNVVSELAETTGVVRLQIRSRLACRFFPREIEFMVLYPKGRAHLRHAAILIG